MTIKINYQHMKYAYSLMLIYFLLNTSITYAQLDFKIDTLAISHIAEIVDKNVIDESLEKGPFIMLYTSIHNKSDSLVTIHLSNTTCQVEYYYNGKKYIFDAILQLYVYSDSLVLSPNQVAELNFGLYLILGTSIHKSDKGDYTREMLEILPTLKIYYIGRSFNVRSSDIERVVIR